MTIAYSTKYTTMRLTTALFIATTSLGHAFSPQRVSVSSPVRQHYVQRSTKPTYIPQDNSIPVAALNMKNQRPFEDGSLRTSKKADGRLSAASISSGFSPSNVAANPPTDTLGNLLEPIRSILPEVDMSNYLPVLSAALLMTSNTVGASMMVLPGLAQGPGMIASSALIGGKSFISCQVYDVRSKH
jgi:hypothetical protein